ncbi:MAG: PHP domain-containing protein, partial [Acetivibrio sp.]
DGTLSPHEIVSLAVEKNLAAIALTDHDTISGVAEAMESAQQFSKQGISIQVISGVEISAAYRHSDIHILGLYVDTTKEVLINRLAKACSEREQRNKKMAANLCTAGLDITIEELRKYNGDAVLTRAHFASLLCKKGYVPDMKSAFTKYLNDKSPYFVPRNYISPEDAIVLIRSAGGIPVLAHPLLYKLSEKEVRSLVLQLKNSGLMGIEALYSGNVSNDESFVRSLAKKYDLLISGGSDFHGSVKPKISLGSGRGHLKVPETLLLPLERSLLDLHKEEF